MQTAAFFDMDGTLLRGESQLSFLLWCWRRSIAPRWKSVKVVAAYLAYLSGVSRDAGQLRDLGFSLFQGLDARQLNDAGEVFFASCLSIRIRRQASAVVQRHRDLNHRTVLVTSASETVARPLAAALKVDELIATHLLLDEGRYSGSRKRPEPYGVEKRLLVEQYSNDHAISLASSYAYSDHHSDLPLLEAVGNPIVVQPTRELREVARQRGWITADLDGPSLQHQIV